MARWFLILALSCGVAFLLGRGSADQGIPSSGIQYVTFGEPAFTPSTTAPNANGIEGMRRILDRVDWTNTPLEQVVDDLRRRTGANIAVNWTALSGAGTERQTPIELHLHDVMASHVLSFVLEQVAGSGARLGFRGEGNLIRVTSRDELDRALVLRVYDVADIIDGATPPVPDTDSQDPHVGGGGNVFGNLGRGRAVWNREVAESLVDLIESIEPEMWYMSGGHGKVMMFGKQMSVIATPEIQVHVADLLHSLRNHDRGLVPTTMESLP